jgi:hydrogenase nickel incorporation protein HypA/HybF
MHEYSLMRGLMRKIESVARDNQARRVVGVRVRLGALSHMTPEHFREHFEHAARGTLAEDARLDFELGRSGADPRAHDVWLLGITVEE